MKPSLVIFLLGVKAATVAGDCFDSSFTGGDAHYRECCSTDRRQGSGSIDGAPYDYECDAWTNSFYKGRPMQNAGQCARYCNSNSPCSSAIFSPSAGYCFISTDADAASSYQQGYLTLRKKGDRTSQGDCQQQVNAATANCNQQLNTCNAQNSGSAQCEADKSNLRNELATCNQRLDTCNSQNSGSAQCDADKANLRNELATCKSEKDSLAKTMKTQCDAEKANCQNQLTACTTDKASIEQKMRAECDAQKAQCQNDLTSCNTEKASMSQTMTAQCDADKANCRKELTDTKTQLDQCKANGSVGTAGSGTSGGDPELAKNMEALGLTPISSICPRYHGKEFTTTTTSGNTAKWKIHCDSFCHNHNFVPKTGYTGDPVAKWLRDRQDNKQYRGVFWRHDGVYQDVTPNPVTGWSQFYVQSPVALHAYIERVNFDS